MPGWSAQAENLRGRLLDASERSGQPRPVEFHYLRTQTGHAVRHTALGDIATTTDAAFDELRKAGLIQVLSETPTEVRFYASIPEREGDSATGGSDPAALMGRVDRLRDILSNRATGGSGYGDEDEYRELRSNLRTDPEVGPLLPTWLKQVRNLDDWWAFIKPKFGSYVERRAFLAEEFDPVMTQLEEKYHGVVPVPPARPQRPATPASTPRVRGDVEDVFDLFGLNAWRTAAPSKPAAPSSGPRPVRVFVVHGCDHGPRDAVARLLLQLGFEPVILEELPNQGRTIIEKFEDYSDVSYALVVMTPDDIGGPRGGRASPRARQNVVLELGFFIGRLGRDHVAALVVGTIETPSDVQGVVYIKYDDSGAWKGRVAREMRAANLPADLNRIT